MLRENRELCENGPLFLIGLGLNCMGVRLHILWNVSGLLANKVVINNWEHQNVIVTHSDVKSSVDVRLT